MTRPTAQDALTEEELEHLLGTVNTRGATGKRNLALLTLMADSGLRLAEALGVQTGDLEREGSGRVVTRVRVMGKGHKPATVTVTARAAARLDTWLQARAALRLGNGAVFCTVTRGQQRGGFGGEHTLAPGRALNPRYVRDLVGRLARRAGLERRVTPHTLRHTFATHLLRQTGNLELTRKALRHARITTTAAIYSHLADRDVEAAVRALRPEAQDSKALREAPAAPADPLAAALGQLTGEQRAALVAALGR